MSSFFTSLNRRAAMSMALATRQTWRGRSMRQLSGEPPFNSGNCGQKMKLIYALQVCGLGVKVYKGLIFRLIANL
jgi:hypothetical protein